MRQAPRRTAPASSPAPGGGRASGRGWGRPLPTDRTSARRSAAMDATPVLSSTAVAPGVVGTFTVRDGDALVVGDASVAAALPGHTAGMTGLLIGDTLPTGDGPFCDSVASPELQANADPTTGARTSHDAHRASRRVRRRRSHRARPHRRGRGRRDALSLASAASGRNWPPSVRTSRRLSTASPGSGRNRRTRLGSSRLTKGQKPSTTRPPNSNWDRTTAWPAGPEPVPGPFIKTPGDARPCPTTSR